MDRQNIIAVANELADAARTVVLPMFRSGSLEADNKDRDGFDPVTKSDRDIERAMRDILNRRRPQDAILGEEYGNQAGQSGLTWVLDPIDGTRSFISGLPLWGVLIAIANENGPVYGLIDQPYTEERFEGGFGKARMTRHTQRQPLRTLGNRPLSEALLFSTYPDLNTIGDTEQFQNVSRQTKMTRYGADCYAYAMLAAGHIDLVIESGLQAYDICAPIAVIEAAGGIVSDWQGNPAHHGGQIIAAAGRQQYDEALKLLNS